MLRLHQFQSVWGLPSPSPFCLKLETYLRMAGIPFENIADNDVHKAPKKKMPYIEEDGQRLGDSNLIIEHLKSSYGDRLDRHLTTSQKAVALGFRRLIEENLYWSIVYSRWLEDKGWEVTRKAFFGKLPPIVRQIVPVLARRSLRREFWGQGMGRHHRGEIYKIGMADLTALSEFLEHKPYFFGDEPCTLDATAYGFLANILWVPIKSPLKEWLQTLPNLVEFCQRVRDQYFHNSEA